MMTDNKDMAVNTPFETKIEVHWSESESVQDGSVFSSFADFNQALRDAQQEAKECGLGDCYFKTKYSVTVNDDKVYTGRLDVQEDGTDTDIGSSIRSHCEWMLTDEGTAFAQRCGEDNAVGMAHAKARYWLNVAHLADATDQLRAATQRAAALSVSNDLQAEGR